MAQYDIREERQGPQLYIWVNLYAGTEKIASFPSPKVYRTAKGRVIHRANPLCDSEKGWMHSALNGVTNLAFLWAWIQVKKMSPDLAMPHAIHKIVYGG